MDTGLITQHVGAQANSVAAKEMYDKYSTVTDEFLALRGEVVRRRKPRNVWVRCSVTNGNMLWKQRVHGTLVH